MSIEKSNHYSLFLEFIDSNLPSGFCNIRPDDPIVKRVDEMLIKHGQHFHIADMLQLKMLYVHPAIERELGIKPADYNPAVELDIIHPDDNKRYCLSRSKLLKLSTELNANNGDYALMSTNLRIKHTAGHFVHYLLQGYIFWNSHPRPSVYGLIIKTNIEKSARIKHGFHYYLGKDFSKFRLPDPDLISTGCLFTNREYEILNQLRLGLDSIAIGKKLFISQHTVDTHRRNILKKTGKTSTSELIIDLQENGFF